MSEAILLDPENIDLSTLRRLWQGAPARLDDSAQARIAASAEVVERIVAGGETVYGVNTGFGLLANTRIPGERLAELQRNLILSHACGLGEPLPRHVVRLMIVTFSRTFTARVNTRGSASARSGTKQKCDGGISRTYTSVT